MPTAAPRKSKRSAKRSAGPKGLARRKLASPGGAITIPGPRHPWTWMVSPAVLECRRGEVVPQLAKAWHIPGLGGNGRRGDGTGAIKELAAIGYTEVPHDIECMAWGQPRDGEVSNYIDRYEVDGVVYHSDAWHRPRVLGHLTRWEYDADGMHDFLLRCRALVMDEPEDWHIEIATASALQAIESLRGRDTYAARQQMQTLLGALPAAQRPTDLAASLG